LHGELQFAKNNSSDRKSIEHQVYAFGEQAGGMSRRKRQHSQKLRKPLSERFLPLLEAPCGSETGFFSSPEGKPPSESVGAIVRWRSQPSRDRVPPRAAVTNSRGNTLSLICQSVIPLLKLLDRSVNDAHLPKKPGFLPHLRVRTKFFRKKTGFLIPGA
jgi:hypothetical protein